MMCVYSIISVKGMKTFKDVNGCRPGKIADIRFYKRIIIPVLNTPQILKVSRISQSVHIDNPYFVVIFPKHIMDIIGTDKTGAPWNVLGTAVMLNCAKAAWELPDGTYKADKKFLHVSTDEVYGSLEEDGGYFYETTPYAPHSPYSASKAGSDMLVTA